MKADPWGLPLMEREESPQQFAERCRRMDIPSKGSYLDQAVAHLETALSKPVLPAQPVRRTVGYAVQVKHQLVGPMGYEEASDLAKVTRGEVLILMTTEEIE